MVAGASRHLCRSVYQVARCVPAKRKCLAPRPFPSQLSQSRTFHASQIRGVDEVKPTPPAAEIPTSNDIDKQGDSDPFNLASLDDGSLQKPTTPYTVDDLDPEERASYDQLSKAKQKRYLAETNHVKAVLDAGFQEEEIEKITTDISREIDREAPFNIAPYRPRPMELGYWGEDEDDEFGLVEDDDDEVREQDITTVAHSQLEVHREVREYTRIAAWDMPLLSKFSKPFTPPPLTHPLRFRYTTYMGESHPAARKVVVQLCASDLPDSLLSPAQKTKLLKLAGVHYNPESDVIKLSCEKFENPAQNKRYLGDLVAKLIKEAKEGADTFEDVPLDLRHSKPKRRPVYPEEWKMREERVKQLKEVRETRRLLEEGSTVVDGEKMVEDYVRLLPMRMLT